MKNLFLATLTTVALASSAAAGNFAVSIPNLSFPTTSDVTVSKECLTPLTTTQACIPQE